jgi:hypothetical protein
MFPETYSLSLAAQLRFDEATLEAILSNDANSSRKRKELGIGLLRFISSHALQSRSFFFLLLLYFRLSFFISFFFLNIFLPPSFFSYFLSFFPLSFFLSFFLTCFLSFLFIIYIRFYNIFISYYTFSCINITGYASLLS